MKSSQQYYLLTKYLTFSLNKKMFKKCMYFLPDQSIRRATPRHHNSYACFLCTLMLCVVREGLGNRVEVSHAALSCPTYRRANFLLLSVVIQRSEKKKYFFMSSFCI